MIKKRDTQDILLDATLELVRMMPVEQLTVKKISDHSGISTRSFYNHYRDKFDAINAVYIREMEPYIHASLQEWETKAGELFFRELAFFRNAFSYSGPDSLYDTMVNLSVKKYVMHLDDAVLQDAKETRDMLFSIAFYANGKAGVAKDSFELGKLFFKKEYSLSAAAGVERISRLSKPEILKASLTQMPQREFGEFGKYWNKLDAGN